MLNRVLLSKSVMDFQLNEEQRAFADSVRRLAETELGAGALERAHNPGFPYDVAQLFGRNGLMGIAMKPEDGGQGGNLMDAVIAIQETALICPKSDDVLQEGTFGPIRTSSAERRVGKECVSKCRYR